MNIVTYVLGMFSGVILTIFSLFVVSLSEFMVAKKGHQKPEEPEDE